MLSLLQGATEGSSNLLPTDQKIVAVTLAIVMIAVVIELVRRHKLREEYSLLWIGTAFTLLVLALWPGLLSWFQSMIGAKLPTSALFFGALVFLMLVALQFSIRLTRLTTRNRVLVQKVALLQEQVEKLRERDVADDTGEHAKAQPPDKAGTT